MTDIKHQTPQMDRNKLLIYRSFLFCFKIFSQFFGSYTVDCKKYSTPLQTGVLELLPQSQTLNIQHFTITPNSSFTVSNNILPAAGCFCDVHKIVVICAPLPPPCFTMRHSELLPNDSTSVSSDHGMFLRVFWKSLICLLAYCFIFSLKCVFS